MSQHHPRPVPEVVLVLAGDAEQIADRVDGEWEGELVNEIGAASFRELVDELVGQLLYARREFRHATRGERLGHEPPEPCVVRRIDIEQMSHQLGLALTGDTRLALGVGGFVVVSGVLAEPLISESLLGIRVPGDQPGLYSAREAGLVHGGVLAEPGVRRVGIGGELPGEEFGGGGPTSAAL